MIRRKAGQTQPAAAQAAASATQVAGLDPPAYSKLYKQLGTRNNNKDVRGQIQQRLNGSLEAPMSPNFQLNVNPGYQMDNDMHVTTNRVNLTGERV